MKKVFALITALAFTAPIAAPIAAQAQTFLTPHADLVQKVQSTYHTDFQNTGK